MILLLPFLVVWVDLLRQSCISTVRNSQARGQQALLSLLSVLWRPPGGKNTHVTNTAVSSAKRQTRAAIPSRKCTRWLRLRRWTRGKRAVKICCSNNKDPKTVGSNDYETDKVWVAFCQKYRWLVASSNCWSATCPREQQPSGLSSAKLRHTSKYWHSSGRIQQSQHAVAPLNASVAMYGPYLGPQVRTWWPPARRRHQSCSPVSLTMQ